MKRMFLLGVLLGSAIGGGYVTAYGSWGFLICLAPAAGLIIGQTFEWGYQEAKRDSQADRETERS